jgi:transposase
VDRGRRAVKRHLISDGLGTPLGATLSAANINDYGFLLPLLDKLSGCAAPAGCRVLADRGYDAKAVRAGIEARGFQPHIPERNRPGQGRRRDTLARQRSVIERTFSWLSWMRRLATRWERHDHLYLAFLLLGCANLCWRRLKHTF